MEAGNVCTGSAWRMGYLHRFPATTPLHPFLSFPFNIQCPHPVPVNFLASPPNAFAPPIQVPSHFKPTSCHSPGDSGIIQRTRRPLDTLLERSHARQWHSFNADALDIIKASMVVQILRVSLGRGRFVRTCSQLGILKIDLARTLGNPIGIRPPRRNRDAGGHGQ